MARLGPRLLSLLGRTAVILTVFFGGDLQRIGNGSDVDVHQQVSGRRGRVAGHWRTKKGNGEHGWVDDGPGGGG